jgi:putative membrane protein
VVVAVVGWGVLSWWSMRFRLGTETLRIESGILIRRSRRIRLDRVQAVEVQQPLLGRLLGMAELAIETAGSGTEATLAYLRLDHAHRLRAELLERSALAGRRAPVGGEPSAGPAGTGTEAGPPPSEAPPEVLHRVPPGRLFLSQLVRTAPLVTMAITTAVVAVMVALGEPLGVTVLVPAGIAVVSTVGRGFIGQYGFELTRTRRGLGVRAGLLDVRSQSIPLDRVQGVVVLEPIVWRWLGWCEVQVTVAGVDQRGDDDAHLTATLMPVIAGEEGARMVAEVLGGRDARAVALHPGPRAARRLDPVGWRVQALGVADDLLVARRGVLVRRTDLVPRHKIQSCAVRQGPLQRRLGLATLHAHLPPGPVDAEARHRTPTQAWELALSLASPHDVRAAGRSPV